MTATQMTKLETGVWSYRDHIILQVSKDTYVVYWRTRSGWEMWDCFKSLRLAGVAIECVAQPPVAGRPR